MDVCGLSEADALGVVDELAARAPAALDAVLGDLPAGVPVELAEAIARGVRARFGLPSQS